MGRGRAWKERKKEYDIKGNDRKGENRKEKPPLVVEVQTGGDCSE